MRRLEIGPGEHGLGFETMDIVGGDLTGDWADGIPCEDEVYDEVYASHVLEHVPWFATQVALAEVWRVLRPGGMFEVWVPDFAYIVASYMGGACGDQWRAHNPDGDPMLWLNGRIFTRGPAPNWHRAVFDAVSLRACMEKVGFRVERATRTRGVSHGPIDLGMKGYKDAQQ